MFRDMLLSFSLVGAILCAGLIAAGQLSGCLVYRPAASALDSVHQLFDR